MAEIYGDFTDSVIRLNDGLREVRTVWNDKTARTYDTINENMEHFAKQVWENYSYARQGYESAKMSYNESEIDEQLSLISSKISSV